MQATIKKLVSQTKRPQIGHTVDMKPEKVIYSGPNLKAVRKKRRLSQEDLAKPVELTRYAVMGYEQGKETPRADVLEVWGDMLNVEWRIPPRSERLASEKAEKKPPEGS